MIEKAANGIKSGTPPSYIGKTISYLDRIMTPVSTYIAYIGAAILGALVMMLMYSIVARRLFDAPLRGSMEMTELSLVLITFFMLAYDSLKGESVIVEIVTSLFPKRTKEITATVVLFIAFATLCMASRQIVIQAIKVQNYGQTTPILHIPICPFLYVTAFGIILLTVVYLKHFLHSLDMVISK